MGNGLLGQPRATVGSPQGKRCGDDAASKPEPSGCTPIAAEPRCQVLSPRESAATDVPVGYVSRVAAEKERGTKPGCLHVGAGQLRHSWGRGPCRYKSFSGRRGRSPLATDLPGTRFVHLSFQLPCAIRSCWWARRSDSHADEHCAASVGVAHQQGPDAPVPTLGVSAGMGPQATEASPFVPAIDRSDDRLPTP